MRQGELRLELWEDERAVLQKRWVFIKKPHYAKELYKEFRTYLDDLSEIKNGRN